MRRLRGRWLMRRGSPKRRRARPRPTRRSRRGRRSAGPRSPRRARTCARITSTSWACRKSAGACACCSPTCRRTTGPGPSCRSRCSRPAGSKGHVDAARADRRAAAADRRMIETDVRTDVTVSVLASRDVPAGRAGARAGAGAHGRLGRRREIARRRGCAAAERPAFRAGSTRAAVGAAHRGAQGRRAHGNGSGPAGRRVARCAYRDHECR